MEEGHCIEWIALITDNREEYHYLNPKEESVVLFNKVSKGKLYSYCNKQGLWVEEIDK